MVFIKLALLRSLHVGVLFIALFSAATAQTPSQQFVVMGTGGVTGVYYPAGGAICRVVNGNREQHGIRCSIESTQGSVANLNALNRGEFDLAIAQSDADYHAYNGTDVFAASGSNRDLRTVIALHSETFSVVVRADSGIQHFDDLIGKRVNIGNPGSGHRQTMEEVMRHKGWSQETFSGVSELTSTEQAKALCNHQIDAFVFSAGHPSGVLKDAASRCDIMFVDVNGSDIDRLVEGHDFYKKSFIPAGLYRGVSHDIPTFSINALLMASQTSNDEFIYQLVKNIFNDFEQLQRMHPVFKQLSREQMASNHSDIPTHEGAQRYFTEVGLR